jgi:hypothetical protein
VKKAKHQKEEGCYCSPTWPRVGLWNLLCQENRVSFGDKAQALGCVNILLLPTLQNELLCA